MESIFIKCSNCDRSTGLRLNIKTVKEMSAKFMLNKKFHHMVFLRYVIQASKQNMISKKIIILIG